jgi:hypothetical protein
VARTARATGLVERSGDNDPAPFFWNFLVGITQSDGSVAKVNNLYETFTDHNATYSSIQDYFTIDATAAGRPPGNSLSNSKSQSELQAKGINSTKGADA